MSLVALLQTPTGQAVSTAVANGLSLLAIVIAVVVALVEQRRANAEKQREQSRERLALERAEADQNRRREALITASLDLVDRAHLTMTTGLPALGEMFVQWVSDKGKPLELISLESTILAIRAAALDNVELILLLSRAALIVHATAHPTGTDGSPPVGPLLAFLKEQSAALAIVREEIARLGGRQA